MKFGELRLCNFGSFYGEHSFQLGDRGLVLVEGVNQTEVRMDSNGSGKSTLFRALDWALWGINPTGDTAAAVMNAEVAEARGAECWVEVDLVDDSGALIQIRRWRMKSKSGLEVTHAGRSLENLDTRETQKRIEELLGLDREVFHATVLFGQEDVEHYADATDAERMATLTRILRLEELDVLLERAKAQRKAAQVDLTRAQADLDRVTAQRGALGLEFLQEQSETWEKRQKQVIADAAARLAEASAHVENQRAAVARAAQAVAQLEAEASGLEAQIAELGLSVPESSEAFAAQGELTRLEGELAAARQNQVADPFAEERAAILAELVPLREELSRPAEVPPELAAAQEAERVAESAVAVAKSEQWKAQADLNVARDRKPGVCPTCGQAVKADLLRHELTKLSNRLLGCESTLKRAEEDLARAKQEVAQEAERVQHAFDGRRQRLRHLESSEAEIYRRAEEARQQAEEALDGLHTAIQSARGKLDAARTQHQAMIQTRQAQQAECRVKLERVRAQIRETQQAQGALDAALAAEAGAAGQLAGAERAVNPHAAGLHRATEMCKSLDADLAQAQGAIHELEQHLPYLEFWVSALGAKGLKSFILDARLQDLTTAANRWMEVLTGGTTWVRFEAQRKTGSGKLVNAPDIRVFRYNPDGSITERAYRSLSGGEKQRVSFAVDFGLSGLVAQRATQSYDLLILDEVFRHLDRSGKQAVVESLQALAAQKSSLFVVEHDADFQDAFDTRVQVLNKDRRSRILPAEER